MRTWVMSVLSLTFVCLGFSVTVSGEEKVPPYLVGPLKRVDMTNDFEKDYGVQACGPYFAYAPLSANRADGGLLAFVVMTSVEGKQDISVVASPTHLFQVRIVPELEVPLLWVISQNGRLPVAEIVVSPREILMSPCLSRLKLANAPPAD